MSQNKPISTITTFHEGALLPQPQPFTFKKQTPQPNIQHHSWLPDCHCPSLHPPLQKSEDSPKKEPHCPPSALTVLHQPLQLFSWQPLSFLQHNPPQNIKQCSDPETSFNPALFDALTKAQPTVKHILWSSRPPSPTPLHFQAFPNGCLKESPQKEFISSNSKWYKGKQPCEHHHT